MQENNIAIDIGIVLVALIITIVIVIVICCSNVSAFLNEKTQIRDTVCACSYWLHARNLKKC